MRNVLNIPSTAKVVETGITDDGMGMVLLEAKRDQPMRFSVKTKLPGLFEIGETVDLKIDGSATAASEPEAPTNAAAASAPAPSNQEAASKDKPAAERTIKMELTQGEFNFLGDVVHTACSLLPAGPKRDKVRALMTKFSTAGIADLLASLLGGGISKATVVDAPKT